ncbi:MAG: kelch repeat-containing protein [Polyangiaceae bacterium]
MRLSLLTLLPFAAVACATYSSDGFGDDDTKVFEKPGDKDAASSAPDTGARPTDAGSTSETSGDAGGPLPPWSAYSGPMTTDGAALWDGIARTWSLAPAPTELVTRGTMCSVTDNEGRAIYFGGHNSGGGAKSTSDLFRFDGTRWDVLRASVGFPPPRSGAGCFIHPTTGDFFVFGGITYDGANAPVYLTDTWKWDGKGTTWASLGVSPWGSSVSPGYAVDTKRKLLIMRGGGAPTGRHKETYDWTGSAWTLWPSDNDYVSNLAIAYHGTKEVALRLGGLNPGNSITATCEVSNAAANSWSACSGTISARYNHAMTYDPAGQQIVVFGGLNAGGTATQDTWTWNGSWTVATGGVSPPAKHSSAFTYVKALQKLVLVGGF